MSKKLINIVIIITIIAIFSYVFIFFKSRGGVSTTKINTYSINQNFEKVGGDTEMQTEKVKVISFFQKEELDEKIQNKYTIEPKINTLSNINSIIEKVFTYTNTETQEKDLKENITEINQKVFKILYPDYFVSGLSYTQEFFIKQKFLDENYKKIENFDTEEKIFSFVNTIIDVSEKQNIYSKDDADKFKIGVNKTWKSLLSEEKTFWTKKLIGSNFFNKTPLFRQYSIRKYSNKKVILVFKHIKDIFSPTAQAVGVATPVLCFQKGPPMPIGANIWAPCCNCGWAWISSDTQQWFNNCYGAPGGMCQVPYGCLNLYAKNFLSAIWDPMTGICGVG